MRVWYFPPASLCSCLGKDPCLPVKAVLAWKGLGEEQPWFYTVNPLIWRYNLEALQWQQNRLSLPTSCWDRDLTDTSWLSVKDGKRLIVFDKMQENVCIAQSERVLAVSSIRVPLFLLLTSVSELINLDFKLFIIVDSVQFWSTVFRNNQETQL